MKNYKLIVFIETWNRTYNNKNIGKLIKSVGRENTLIIHEDPELSFCNFVYLNKIVNGNIWEILINIFSVYKIFVKNNDVTVLSYSGYNINIVLIALKALLRFKLIIKNDSQLIKKSNNLRGLVRNYFKRKIIQKCDILISETSDVYRHYERLRSKEKHILWRNGVDLQSDYFTEETRKFHLGDYILFTGRLSWLKGIDIAVEAFLAADVDIELKILGLDMADGAVDFAKNLIHTAKYKNRLVTWYDPVDIPEIYEFYRKARFSIITSRDEGLPNRMAESIALGTPVLSLDVGRVNETLACGVGKVVEDVESFSKEIRLWCTDDKLIQSLGRNCIRYRNEYLNEGAVLKQLKREIE